MNPDFLERIEWFALGSFLGFVLGYIVAHLRAIEQKVDDVDNDIKRIRDEKGVMSQGIAANIALFAVVVVTLYAALLSQAASNNSGKTAEDVLQIQADQKQNLDCTTQILFDAIEALNERTTYSAAQNDSNIALQKDQLNFLTRFLTKPPPNESQQSASFQTYVDSVMEFLELTEATKTRQMQNPYPKTEDLTRCLAQSNADTKEPSQ